MATTPITGNFEATSGDIFVNGQILVAGAIVVNSTEQIAYIANRNGSANGALILQLNITSLSYTALTPTVEGENLNPSGLAISLDDSTLYLLSESGRLYSISTSSGVKTLLSDAPSSIGAGWATLLRSNLNPNILFLISRTDTRLFAYNLTSGAIELVQKFPFITTAMCLDITDKFYVAGYSPSVGRIVRFLPDQGRWFLAAGSGTEGFTDGEALLQAELWQPYTISCTKDGSIVYVLNNRGGLRMVSNGLISSFSNLFNNEDKCGLVLMPNANKILYSESIHVIKRAS